MTVCFLSFSLKCPYQTCLLGTFINDEFIGFFSAQRNSAILALYNFDSIYIVSRFRSLLKLFKTKRVESFVIFVAPFHWLSELTIHTTGSKTALLFHIHCFIFIRFWSIFPLSYSLGISFAWQHLAKRVDKILNLSRAAWLIQWVNLQDVQRLRM